MKQKWCRTEVLKPFENSETPEVAQCSDCGRKLSVRQRADGTNYFRKHKIVNNELYSHKMAFERAMKNVTKKIG